MLSVLSHTEELRGKLKPASTMEPSEYEPGMQLNVSIFTGDLFELRVVDKKKPSLAITSRQILEVVKNSQSNESFYIVGVHQLQSVVKVQVRRGSGITFYFRSGLSRSYHTTEATACCECLKKHMKLAGMQAQHTSAMIEHEVSTGYELLEAVRQLEERFSLAPSLELVQAMMGLTRQAVECLGEAQDSRHRDALRRLQMFLTRADVTRLLDGGTGKRTTEEQGAASSAGAGGVTGVQQKGSGEEEEEDDKGVFNTCTVEGEDFGANKDSRLEQELYALIKSLEQELSSIVESR